MDGDLYLNFQCPCCGEYTVLNGDYTEPDAIVCWNCKTRFAVSIKIDSTPDECRLEMAKTLGL